MSASSYLTKRHIKLFLASIVVAVYYLRWLSDNMIFDIRGFLNFNIIQHLFLSLDQIKLVDATFLSLKKLLPTNCFSLTNYFIIFFSNSFFPESIFLISSLTVFFIDVKSFLL